MNVPCRRSLRSVALAAALTFGATVPAVAVCPVCNSSVRFDRSLATCFQDRVDGELRRLESEGRGFIIVDLSDCETDASRGGLPTDPKARAALDDSFIADDRSLRCLGEAIARHNGSLDPSVLFELSKICS
jgi:hypothetical protein